MGQNSLTSIFRRRVSQAEPTNILPYFGVAATTTPAQKNAAFILALPSRGPTPSRANPSFTLNADTNAKTMYYAYPVSYGQAVFTDIAAQFQGGWDGAHADFGQTLGPIIVPVMVGGVSVNFYLYETDYPNLGSIEWSAA